MFGEVQTRSSRSARAAWCASALLHAIALLFLLHTGAPRFLAPSSVVHGNDGTVIAHLYWPNQSEPNASDATAGPASSASRRAAERRNLIFPSKNARDRTARFAANPRPETDAQSKSAEQSQQPIPAGSTYGSALDGKTYGYEIRPALPVFSPDPAVDAADFAGIEGDVVVEVTIDEHGTIVQKTVVQSLRPTLDNKVLAALANWQFRPATRDGVPIPSKQDVYYHFPPLHHG